jgi:hypothetical protein
MSSASPESVDLGRPAGTSAASRTDSANRQSRSTHSAALCVSGTRMAGVDKAAGGYPR